MWLLRPPFRVARGSAGALSASAAPKPAPKGRPIAKGDHLYLIDGSGYIFRAYHALPPLSRKSDGLPTGAVSGYCNMLWKLLQDMKGWEKPTHLAVIFDAGQRTFRNEIYAQYKANRSAPPDDLIPQFPLVREATRAFGVACVEQAGYEADDLIATYTRLAREAGARVTIVSSDKDLMQLVFDGTVELLDTMKNKRIGGADVIERFGVPPEKVREVQALAGDSIDNVPGVPGVGIKTAAELLNTYGDLETLLARAGEIKQPKRRETILANAENARISLKLVTLDDNAKFSCPIDEMEVQQPEPVRLLGFLNALELTALAKRAASRLGIDDRDSIKPNDPVQRDFSAPGGVTPLRPEPVAEQKALTKQAEPGAILDRNTVFGALDLSKYETVTTLERLHHWIARAQETGRIAIKSESTSSDPMCASLCGIALAVAPGEAAYIPCGHRAAESLDLASEKGGVAQLAEAEILQRLGPLLQDDSVLKIGHDLKRDYLMLLERGVEMNAIDDTMLMSYVLDSTLHAHDYGGLSVAHLNHTRMTLEELTGKGRDRVAFDCADVKLATRYSAEDADLALRLHAILKPRLIAERKRTVYETLERPMVRVLAGMEREGITIDPDFLRKLSNDFAQSMSRLEQEIYKEAGGQFNIGSPKQLGDYFFGNLKLPGGRKTKTGAWSTDSDVLEELAAQGHDIARNALEWRQLAKLRGTYTDALPTYVNPKTGRVHTSFALAAASTGRLASVDPNLQNIPIRTEEGRRIRRAFVAPPGRKLVSADYSQIELRLLAHIANVPELKQAFAEGIDIHALTASEMFNVPVAGMPSDIRRRAKAINFGIVYGISAFGLANQLGIGRDEAGDYIKKYFQKFPGIRDYMEETKAFARQHGYVETLFGRRVHIREINSRIPGHRGGAERAAINAPIQGAAADIIRRAMIRMPDALSAAKLTAKMLLQVHDELIFEAPDDEVDAVCATARSVMEKAALPAVELSVPLVVDARAARNWDEAH
ncbi:DNA polymerase I [Bradyrhizobium sp.]|uniref:DNA polymerase I n=1 Tax=Bradyrhizobium sp. TaxID=376 RepID=UPI003417D7C4